MLTRHIWQEYLERAEDIRHSPAGKATYALRSQTIERVFADAKEKHAMRYTPYRGLAAVTAWVKLKFAAMNLKKLALHKWRLFLLFYLHLLQEATSLRCKVASLTVCARSFLTTGAACRKSPPAASFSEICGVSLSSLRDSRAGNAVRKPCCARLPNPPHMSPDSDCIWRATARQTTQRGFLTACARSFLTTGVFYF